MSRHDLTDREHEAIRQFLPSTQKGLRGRPWIDHRTVINGILWVLRTGSPWRDLPAEFGKWQLFTTVSVGGFTRSLGIECSATLCIDWTRRGKLIGRFSCVDGSIVRAHRSASGMITKSEENDEMVVLGRSRGVYTTKIHVLTDATGTLLAVTATPGQRNESTEFGDLLEGCNLSMYRLKNRREAIAGDRGYSSRAIREQF